MNPGEYTNVLLYKVRTLESALVDLTKKYDRHSAKLAAVRNIVKTLDETVDGSGLTFGDVISHLKYAKFRMNYARIFDSNVDDSPDTAFEPEAEKA